MSASMPQPALSRRPSRIFFPHPLLLISLVAAAAVGVPVLGVLANLAGGEAGAGTFLHLWSTVLPEYLGNSLAIVVIVGLLSAAIGIGCA
ncbi:MAG TPA: hypothetical protein VF797_10740, partial [Noviherbaspirillum sp.]